MKYTKETFVILGLLVALTGCKDDVQQYADSPLDTELAENVMKLDREALKLTIQNGWYRSRLENCISRLEEIAGLEKMPFDWSEATGFPPIRKDPNALNKTLETLPFYSPFPKLTVSQNINEKYRTPEWLNAYIEMQINVRQSGMLGVEDKYIAHLEKRLKRLDGSFGLSEEQLEYLEKAEVRLKRFEENLKEPNTPR